MMKNGMKNMFRMSSILVIGLLAACGNTGSESDSSAATTESEQEQVYIGILHLTTHPALDQITEGIMDELAAAGYVDGENATIDFQNAQGDQANMKSIAESFVSHDADIMIGVATPAAQALKNASDEIPVILGAVQDPVGAGLVESLEAPGSNATGLSNRTPSNEQMALIKQFLPDATTIGVMYTTAEDNAIISGQRAEQAAADLGFEVVTRTITTSNDIAQAAESLAKEVDAIYVPNDNVIASGMATLVDAADAFGIPVFPAADTMVKDGGVATFAPSQYGMGTQIGQIAVDILKGADPATYPVQLVKENSVYINQAKVDELGLTIPEEVKADAMFVELAE
ncbi:tryptophan ABC transporter substrate-binding protein [Trichococcus collinsii]|uniref:ABC transport system substrate-binding protein n=1 Tax=Trichococcus collinsii TaxID=157076 RepID=A0AB37ZYA6_9LACT|nr:tryptophan ABC transporter substrate-binding protein [Trichococcus collinsii]CZR09119.1 Hypothetical protein Tcol_2842 [Trichococcus collinsii]SEA17442.1 putative ABC transport system substrate-binding protein [Trichococcus collinsii]